jgi:hypothetical protein
MEIHLRRGEMEIHLRRGEMEIHLRRGEMEIHHLLGQIKHTRGISVSCMENCFAQNGDFHQLRISSNLLWVPVSFTLQCWAVTWGPHEHWLCGSTNKYMFNSIDIYSFIPASGCICMGPSALLCMRAYNPVKTAQSHTLIKQCGSTHYIESRYNYSIQVNN